MHMKGATGSGFDRSKSQAAQVKAALLADEKKQKEEADSTSRSTEMSVVNDNLRKIMEALKI